MAILLAIITILSYLLGGFAFLKADTGGGDIHHILGVVYFTCGTLALISICLQPPQSAPDA